MLFPTGGGALPIGGNMAAAEDVEFAEGEGLAEFAAELATECGEETDGEEAEVTLSLFDLASKDCRKSESFLTG